MAKIVQRRRGSTSEHNTFTGLDGEITVNTSLNTVHIHDGSTIGGFPLARADGSNLTGGSISISSLGVTDGTAGQVLSTDGNENLSFINIGLSSLGINDGTAGQVLSTDGSGTFSFIDVGLSSLGIVDGTAGQVLSTDGNGNLSFTSQTDVSGSSVGGDLSGTIGNAQIIANAVGITELNVSDGAAGQVLSTDGSGNLSFISGDSISGSSGVSLALAIAVS